LLFLTPVNFLKIRGMIKLGIFVIFQTSDSALKYVTPVQKHNQEDVIILKKRKAVYTEAKIKNPSRWSGDIRNWTPVKEVSLNPDKNNCTEIKIKKAA
jgi:hypothetical protein